MTTLGVHRRSSTAGCTSRKAPVDRGQDGTLRAAGWSVEEQRTVMDRTAVVKVGAAASASVCALFGGVVLAQYIVAKKKRAGKKTRIIEMVSKNSHTRYVKIR